VPTSPSFPCIREVLDEPEFNRALGIRQNSRMILGRKKTARLMTPRAPLRLCCEWPGLMISVKATAPFEHAQRRSMSPTAIAHGSVLLGFFFVVKAWSYGLDRVLMHRDRQTSYAISVSRRRGSLLS
jgi:hypothetical protein